jgi:hypothetical protein
VAPAHHGWTNARGTVVQLYPEAFRNLEQLVKSLGHERMHVHQVQLLGRTIDTAKLVLREKTAEAVEEAFWQ